MKGDKKMEGGTTAVGLGFADVLTIVFVVLKLVGVIDWPWIWVLSPLWISLGLALILIVILFFVFIVFGFIIRRFFK